MNVEIYKDTLFFVVVLLYYCCCVVVGGALFTSAHPSFCSFFRSPRGVGGCPQQQRNNKQQQHLHIIRYSTSKEIRYPYATTEKQP